jgi:myo-inositol-1(or 4)-monophosphatase
VERLPLPAGLAAAARRPKADRLDRDQVADPGRSPVAGRQLEYLAGDLVAFRERLGLRPRVVGVKVGAADPGRADRDQRFVAARAGLGQIDHLDRAQVALQGRLHVANTTPMSDESETLLETALAAARAGARALSRRPARAAMKGGDPINLVTDRDLASQRAVFGLIRRAFPEHRLIGEEDPEALAAPSTGPTWTVDPLDGTSNFAHGHVPFGVSVGHARDGRPLVGAIALPASRALAWAVRGRGAFLRRGGRVRRLRVSERERLAEALVLTGYGYARAGYPAWLRRFERAVSAAQAVRMTGAAVADQVALASGVADVVWEDEYQPWDYAAGALLVEEAGGRVSTIEGRPLPGTPTSFLGTNGRLHEEMVRFLTG